MSDCKLAWYNDEWNRVVAERDSENGREILLERFQWWLKDVWVLKTDIKEFKTDTNNIFE